MRQLLLAAAYAEKPLEAADVVDKVEEFIQGQLGEDVVEFREAYAHAVSRSGVLPLEGIPPP